MIKQYKLTIFLRLDKIPQRLWLQILCWLAHSTSKRKIKSSSLVTTQHSGLAYLSWGCLNELSKIQCKYIPCL